MIYFRLIALILILFTFYSLKSQDFVFTNEQLVNEIIANANDLVQDNADRVYVSYDYGHFFIRENGIWNQYRIPGSFDFNPEYSINSIASDNHGGVWMGTVGKGLVYFDGSSYTFYTTDNSNIPGNDITNIVIHNGNIWMSIRNYGLSLKTGNTYTNIPTTSGSAPFGNNGNPSVFSILPDGTLVVGNGGELIFRNPNGSYNEVFLPDSYSFLSSIEDIYLRSNGEIWLAIHRGGLALYSNGEIISYKDLPGTTLNLVNVIELPNGDVWSTTSTSDIYVFRDLCFKSTTRPSDLFIKQLSIVDNKAAAVSSVNSEKMTYIEIGPFLEMPCELPTVVTNNNSSGIGSLPHAFQLSDLYPGPDTILFDITGSSKTIRLNSSLIALDTIVIDGTSQPGYTNSPLVSLVANTAHQYNGITLSSSGVEIYGLQFHNFTNAIKSSDDLIGNVSIGKVNGGNYFRNNRRDVYLSSNSLSATIYGNTFVGTFWGIYALEIEGKENIIGGIVEGEGNVITGHENAGYLKGTLFAKDLVRGNAISCETNEIEYRPVSNWRTPIPIITAVSALQINGTSVPNGLVDVYVQDNCSSGCVGGAFIGNTTADNSGNWQLSNYDLSSFSESIDFTATATLPETTGTSKFAECVEFIQISGCTNSESHNYNPDAVVDDGSCETCSDGIKNGDETEVDCGGALCDSCPPCDGESITLDETPLNSSHLRYSEFIQARSLILQNNVVNFQATNFITLLPQFEVQIGAEFTISNSPCNQ